MLTKYILHIGETDYELQEDDLRNWDEIRCTYKRDGYGGVVRSFSSQFEFVNHAKDLLTEIYLRDRFAAKAEISVHTINDDWTYTERFRAPLDFSTAEWENYTLKLNSVDNSLVALIKANKSTKYEFEIGKDITPDGTLNFDRIPMQENVVFKFTRGTTFDDRADIVASITGNNMLWLGSCGSEINVGRTIYYPDDQTDDAEGYCVRAEKEVRVRLDAEVAFREEQGTSMINIRVEHLRNGVVIDGKELGSAGRRPWIYIGSYDSSDKLPNPEYSHWATINGKVWYVAYSGSLYYWRTENKTDEEQFLSRWGNTATFDMKPGDVLRLVAPGSRNGTVYIVSSSFQFNWFAVGEPADIAVFKPKTVAKELLRRIAGDSVTVNIDISDHDPRLAKTAIFAAESARDIKDAKFYSSWNEFADWMCAVFGYVYYLGEYFDQPEQPEIVPFQMIVTTPYQPEETFVNEFSEDSIYYNKDIAAFFLAYSKGGYYRFFPGHDKYNKDRHPRTDVLFYELRTGKYWKFGEYEEGKALVPVEVDYEPPEHIGVGEQTVYFVHRSELFKANAPKRIIENSRGLKYSVDTSVIYSTITAGYDKKDYESINGRDEFNFNNTYTTGCSVSDKTLSLLSKYRADSYGVEFAVQKRGENTTDNTSDKDVFFALCNVNQKRYTLDRSMAVEGAISDKVFNGAFSPMACILANAGYVGLQSGEVNLTFASSTGNSSIVIDGTAMSDGLTLSNPIATNGKIEFTTDEVDNIADVNEVIEVIDDGVTYRGFLAEVDVKYARTEAAKYKLIVKEIKP